MKLIACLANGQRIPLDEPFEIHAFQDGDEAFPKSAPLARYSVDLRVQKGGGSSAQSSGGAVSVAAAYNGMTLLLNMKPIR